MAKFSLKEVAHVEYNAEPKDMDPIKFTLKPINADTMLYYYEFETASAFGDMLRVKLAIATQRITGWKGIEDEEGNDVKYTADALFKLMNHKDFLPYMFTVADHTIDEIRKAEQAGVKPTAGEPKEGPKKAKAVEPPNNFDVS